jgi:hypothetical protein
MTTITLNPAAARDVSSPAQRLRQVSAAVRVSFTWLGVRKTLSPEQRSQAAESFGAEGDFLSARKKLLDTTHAAYKEVTAVRGRVIHFWKALTLPYPEPGVRLIRQEQIDSFNQQLTSYRAELQDAVAKLDDHYDELKSAARRRLGELHNPADYPPTLRGLFDLAWEFPNVQPPDYLLQLNPAIYEQERNRIAGRFEEAVRLAEQAFLNEFAGLVSHLCERLSAPSDGEKKVFRDTAVTNLVEFFDRFRQLNVHSSDQLDTLVDQAQNLVRGVEPQTLRANETLRQHVATHLSSVQAVLDGMLIDRPRRSLIRNRPAEGGEA